MNPSHLLSEQSDLREEKEGKGINKWFCSRCWCCYLAIPQDRRTRSSGSPLTPGTLHRACRVWSCRGPSAFHSSHLQGATSTNKTRFAWYFGAESQAWKQLRPNRHRHISQPKLSDDFFIFIFFFLSRSANQPTSQESLRIQGPSRHFPICFHNTWLLQEAAFSFRPLFNHLLFCGSRKQANRKCVKCPVPTPEQAREPFIIQSLVDFSEKTTRQTRDSLALVAPSFRVLSNNKVGHAGNIFQPPALSGVFAYHKRSTASQRFSMLEPRGSLAVELYSTAHPTLRTSFQ